MNVEVNWKGRLSFTGTADSGFEVPMGSYPEVGGDDDGFRPMELMALSLAGCTAMDVISILTKKRQIVHDYSVKVIADRAEGHPKVFTKAVIEYHVAGEGIAENAVTRAMELSADSYCPAQAMLGELIPLELRYYIYEGKTISDAELIQDDQLR
jgi:putative redox protein